MWRTAGVSLPQNTFSRVWTQWVFCRLEGHQRLFSYSGSVCVSSVCLFFFFSLVRDSVWIQSRDETGGGWQEESVIDLCSNHFCCRRQPTAHPLWQLGWHVWLLVRVGIRGWKNRKGSETSPKCANQRKCLTARIRISESFHGPRLSAFVYLLVLCVKVWREQSLHPSCGVLWRGWANSDHSSW